MSTFKLDLSGKFGDEVRREIENNLRKEGIYNVTVRIDLDGQAVFDGSEEDLGRVKEVLHKL